MECVCKNKLHLHKEKEIKSKTKVYEILVAILSVFGYSRTRN